MELVCKDKCFGCTACLTVCPKNLIHMEMDTHGFLFPQIDMDLCVNCGQCKSVCPAENRNEDMKEKFKIEAYAVKNKDAEVLENSASGGIFTALSDYVFSKGGTVYGASHDKSLKTVHTRAVTTKERNTQRGSKYVQSVLQDSYKKVIQDLREGKQVLFSGTPCNCAGLENSLPKDVDRDRLILVDLICNGVPSPLLFNQYIQYCEDKAGKKITEHIHRTKDKGYGPHVEKNVFSDGTFDNSTEYSQAWMTLFYTGNAHRECCYSCPFAFFDKRPADISIGDYWGAQNAELSIPIGNGLSVYFANTERGKKVLSKLKEYLFIEKSDIEKAILMQPRMRGVLANKTGRNKFWEDYDTKGAKYVIEKYGRCSPYIRFKHRVKRILISIGMVDRNPKKLFDKRIMRRYSG